MREEGNEREEGTGPIQVAEYERGIRESVFRKFVERPTVEELLPSIEGLRVLDAGAGPGLGADRMADRGATVAAVDIDRAMCRYANRDTVAGWQWLGETVDDSRSTMERSTWSSAG